MNRPKNNQMIKLVFFCMLLAAGLVSKAQFNAEKDPFLVKNFKESSFQKINAQTSHGNISVSSVPAADARVEMYARAGNGNEKLDKEEIQRRLDENYTLEISVSGGELTAVAKRKNNLNLGKKSLSISFTIYTPQNVSATLRTSHGNIDLSGVTGIQDIGTSHGNLTLETINGKLTGETSHGNISINGSKEDIDLSTSHGNIDAKNCAGAMKLATSQGSVKLNGLKGKVRAHTSHGDIAGDAIEGELSVATSHGNIDFGNLSCGIEASTTHGNINVSVALLAGRISLDNSKGDIGLHLPKGKGVDLDLHAKEIKIDALENFNGSKEAHSMKGSMNGGGVAVKATTGKGTVSLVFR